MSPTLAPLHQGHPGQCSCEILSSNHLGLLQAGPLPLLGCVQHRAIRRFPGFQGGSHLAGNGKRAQGGSHSRPLWPVSGGHARLWHTHAKPWRRRTVNFQRRAQPTLPKVVPVGSIDAKLEVALHRRRVGVVANEDAAHAADVAQGVRDLGAPEEIPAGSVSPHPPDGLGNQRASDGQADACSFPLASILPNLAPVHARA